MAKKEQRKKHTEPVKKDRGLKEVPYNEISFKNPEVLLKYMSSRFKIHPAKKTGVSSRKQRKISLEIKKARFLALLPFTDRHSLR